MPTICSEATLHPKVASRSRGKGTEGGNKLERPSGQMTLEPRPRQDDQTKGGSRNSQKMSCRLAQPLCLDRAK